MRFTLFGFPVVIQPMFWLVGLMFSTGFVTPSGDFDLTSAGMWMGIVLVSVLVHELGHAFAMRAFGRSPSIELWGLGGLTYWGEGPRVSPWRAVVVSLAGPFAGFALGAPFLAIEHFGLATSALAQSAVHMMIFANVWWGALNLLPMIPLDGGHVMEVVVVAMTGPRGARIARVASIALAVGVAIVALQIGETWGLFLAFLCGARSYRELRMPLGGRDGSVPAQEKAKPVPPIDPALEKELESLWHAVRSGEAKRAIDAAELRLETLPEDDASAPARARLVEIVAWGWLEEGDDRQAVAGARRMPKGFAPSALLAARLQLASGATSEGFAALERAYLETPGDLAALVLAAAWIDHRAPARAVAILRGLRGVRVSSDAHNTIAAALFYAEHFSHALEVSELAWNRFRDPVHAYNAACSCARLGRLDDGIVWLGQAVDRGFDDRAKIDSDDDLALLREDPRYAEILRRIR